MSQDDPNSGGSKMMFVGAAAVVLLLLTVAIAVVRHRPAPLATTHSPQAQADPMAIRIVELKGQAERLVIDGRTSEAHEKYREIERLVAGKHIADTGLWDML